jgi:hypothetical protein
MPPYFGVVDAGAAVAVTGEVLVVGTTDFVGVWLDETGVCAPHDDRIISELMIADNATALMPFPFMIPLLENRPEAFYAVREPARAHGLLSVPEQRSAFLTSYPNIEYHTCGMEIARF